MTSSPRSATTFSFDGSAGVQTCSAGTQTDINPKDYIPAQDLSQFDLETVYPSLMQRPRMLTALFIIICLFTYAVKTLEVPWSVSSFVENSRQ